MTLFKQMALAVSLLILAILAAVMIQNYQTTKRSMIESLYQTTVNNIASLSSNLEINANKITPKEKVPAIVKSIIDAAFDSGYYKLIEYKTETYTYGQVDNSPIEGVPKWFISLSNIQIKPITTKVTHDWITLGTLSVVGDTTLTYKALFKIFINLLYLFTLVSIISLALLSLMLHVILKPLKRIKHQAEAILNNEFIIEEEEPYTTEFKDVSNAMNSMVRRVKEILKQTTEALQRNKELQYNDQITGLFNRRYLMIKLPELIQLEGKTKGGSIMLLALDGAAYINQILGRQKADALFFSFARILKESTQIDNDAIISRVNGTEFITVLPNTKKEEIQHIAQNILKKFSLLLKDNTIPTTQANLNIGIYRYKAETTIGELLTKLDTALLQAKNDEHTNIYIYEDTDEKSSLTKTEWRELLEEGIKNHNFIFHFMPVKNIKTTQLIHNVISFEIYTNDDKRYDYNSLIAPAISLGMASKLYLSVVETLFLEYHQKLELFYCSIKLSKEFLEAEDNFDTLSLLFEKQKHNLVTHLCFEISDAFALHKTATVLGYVDLFKKYGFSLGIYSYTAEANDFSYLKQINPEYIKINGKFLLDQTQDAISNLQVITNSLDIILIATEVHTQEDAKVLKKYNIDRFQGAIVDTI